MRLFNSLNLFQKGILLATVMFAMESVLLFGLFMALRSAQSKLVAVEHSRQILACSSTLSKRVFDALHMLTLYGLTQGEMFENRLDKQLADIEDSASTLSALCSHSAPDARDAAVVKQDARRIVAELRSAKAVLDSTYGSELAMTLKDDLSKAGPLLTKMLRDAAIINERHKVIGQSAPGTLAEFQHALHVSLVTGLCLNVVVALLMVLVFARTIGNRLSIVEANSRRFAHGQDLLPLVDGSDEIALVDRAFRKMTSTIEDAARKERLVVDSMPVGFLVLDERLHVIKCNPRFAEQMGKLVAEMTNVSFAEFVPLPESGYPDYLTFFQSKIVGSTFEASIQCPAGNFRAQISASSLESSEGRRFIVNILDVTAQYEIQQMKEEFLSIVSHDLKTPLSSIVASLDVLALPVSGQLNERGQRLVAAMQRESERLVRLVVDLLEVARIESGRLHLETAMCSTSILIADAFDSVKQFAASNNVSLQAGSEEFELLVDRDRIVQALVNLLSNAVKFSEPGQVVLIKAIRKDDWIRLEIIDHGRGIAKDKLAVIFDRFSQLEREDRTKKGGTGLGLTITKLIVEAHKGTIGVESQEGIGSKFWIELPAVSA